MNIFVNARYQRARMWSNVELRRLGPLFSGAIANVSGWDDRDKEGSRYRHYFPHATSYTITNIEGERGLQGADGEIRLDLEQPLPQELERRFDVVLNHTVLEHVFDVFTAFGNLCKMSKDAVIVVVPFAQTEHWSTSYGDYWRFTPGALERLFANCGFTLAYVSANDVADTAVYVLGVGVRDAARWKGRLPAVAERRALATWLGRRFLGDTAMEVAARYPRFGRWIGV
jgi:hypothetical protein